MGVSNSKSSGHRKSKPISKSISSTMGTSNSACSKTGGKLPPTSRPQEKQALSIYINAQTPPPSYDEFLKELRNGVRLRFLNPSEHTELNPHRESQLRPLVRELSTIVEVRERMKQVEKMGKPKGLSEMTPKELFFQENFRGLDEEVLFHNTIYGFELVWAFSKMDIAENERKALLAEVMSELENLRKLMFENGYR